MAENDEATTGPDVVPLPFQRFFNELLRRQKWSLREAGAKVGVAAPNVHAWVHGISTPTEEHQEKVARAARVPLVEITRLVWEQKKLRRAMLARLRAGRGPKGRQEAEPPGSPWETVEALIGTVEGPKDWAAEHDHYLYGLSKRRRTPQR